MTVLNSLPIIIIKNVNDLLELLECECVDDLENFDDTGCKCGRYEFISQKKHYYSIIDNNNNLDSDSIIKLEVDKLDNFTYFDADPYCVECTHYRQNIYIGYLFSMTEAYAFEGYQIRYCTDCEEVIEQTLPINMFENDKIEEIIEDEIDCIDYSEIRNFIASRLINSLHNDGKLASQFIYSIYGNDHDILLVKIIDKIVSNL